MSNIKLDLTSLYMFTYL